MSSELIYRQTLTGVINGAGTATLIFNGAASLTRRALQSITIACSASTPRPICTMRRGSPTGVLMATSRTGDADTFVSDDDSLDSGEALVLTWTGGAPGATVTATVNGMDIRA